MKDAQKVRHDLKNQLMGIQAFAELIRMESKNNKEVEQYLEKIERKIEEMTKSINENIV